MNEATAITLAVVFPALFVASFVFFVARTIRHGKKRAIIIGIVIQFLLGFIAFGLLSMLGNQSVPPENRYPSTNDAVNFLYGFILSFKSFTTDIEIPDPVTQLLRNYPFLFAIHISFFATGAALVALLGVSLFLHDWYFRIVSLRLRWSAKPCTVVIGELEEVLAFCNRSDDNVIAILPLDNETVRSRVNARRGLAYRFVGNFYDLSSKDRVKFFKSMGFGSKHCNIRVIFGYVVAFFYRLFGGNKERTFFQPGSRFFLSLEKEDNLNFKNASDLAVLIRNSPKDHALVLHSDPRRMNEMHIIKNCDLRFFAKADLFSRSFLEEGYLLDFLPEHWVDREHGVFAQKRPLPEGESPEISVRYSFIGNTETMDGMAKRILMYYRPLKGKVILDFCGDGAAKHLSDLQQGDWAGLTSMIKKPKRVDNYLKFSFGGDERDYYRVDPVWEKIELVAHDKGKSVDPVASAIDCAVDAYKEDSRSFFYYFIDFRPRSVRDASGEGKESTIDDGKWDQINYEAAERLGHELGKARAEKLHGMNYRPDYLEFVIFVHLSNPETFRALHVDDSEKDSTLIDPSCSIYSYGNSVLSGTDITNTFYTFYDLAEYFHIFFEVQYSTKEKLEEWYGESSGPSGVKLDMGKIRQTYFEKKGNLESTMLQVGSVRAKLNLLDLEIVINKDRSPNLKGYKNDVLYAGPNNEKSGAFRDLIQGYEVTDGEGCYSLLPSLDAKKHAELLFELESTYPCIKIDPEGKESRFATPLVYAAWQEQERWNVEKMLQGTKPMTRDETFQPPLFISRDKAKGKHSHLLSFRGVLEMMGDLYAKSQGQEAEITHVDALDNKAPIAPYCDAIRKNGLPMECLTEIIDVYQTQTMKNHETGDFFSIDMSMPPSKYPKFLIIKRGEDHPSKKREAKARYAKYQPVFVPNITKTKGRKRGK